MPYNEHMPNLAHATRVRELRVERGLSQQRLATKAELATRTVARIENGEDTTIGTLIAIAGVFGVPVADLLGDQTTAEVAS